jgi:hypothetical protein
VLRQRHANLDWVSKWSLERWPSTDGESLRGFHNRISECGGSGFRQVVGCRNGCGENGGGGVFCARFVRTSHVLKNGNVGNSGSSGECVSGWNRQHPRVQPVTEPTGTPPPCVRGCGQQAMDSPGLPLMERACPLGIISVHQCSSAVLYRLCHPHRNVGGYPQTPRSPGERGCQLVQVYDHTTTDERSLTLIRHSRGGPKRSINMRSRINRSWVASAPDRDSTTGTLPGPAVPEGSYRRSTRTGAPVVRRGTKYGLRGEQRPRGNAGREGCAPCGMAVASRTSLTPFEFAPFLKKSRRELEKHLILWSHAEAQRTFLPLRLCASA